MAAKHLLVTLDVRRSIDMPYQARIIHITKHMLLLSLLCFIGGCSVGVTGGLKEPDVRLIKVDVVKAKLLEQKFVLRFRIDNPNSASLPVRGLVYNVHLNDVKLAEGESDHGFTVPAHGHQIFDVPVRTNLWRHVRRIVKALENPNEPVRYSLTGEVKTGLIFGRNVHVARNGEIIPGDYLPE